MIFRPVHFSPTFGRVLSVVVALAGIVAVVGFVAVGAWMSLAQAIWPIALLVTAAFAMFWLPSITIQEHEVTVRNVLATHHVPWPAIQRIDTKWALTLYTPRGPIAVWAGPAPSRFSVLSTTRGDALGVAESARAAEGSVRTSDTLDTESGAIADVIRRRWELLRDDGLLDLPVDDEAFRRDIHWKTIATLVVLVIATVISSAL